jgi:PDZ domain-containing protein
MASPDDPNRTIIGFNARDTRTVKLPFEIGIDTDEIGGPSAGLAFTVALIDELSPGDLSPPGGVALTGTIAEDGSVGPIGALVQKAIAVKRSGARHFIVPAGQDPADVEEARRAVGTSVEIKTVATLAEALAALEQWGGEPVTRG